MPSLVHNWQTAETVLANSRKRLINRLLGSDADDLTIHHIFHARVYARYEEGSVEAEF